MLLDNRSDEISPPLQAKLDYVRSQLQEDVTQMLYYARLKSSTKDYQFEDINLNDCLGEVLEDYAPLLEEKQFVILNKLQSETVYTDRRGLQFMLGQIVSNAIKYILYFFICQPVSHYFFISSRFTKIRTNFL